MNNELCNLYQEVIIEHNKHPRNFRKIEGNTRIAEGLNPLCGDHLILYVKLENGIIEDISFQGGGCAISKASASLMTIALKGKKQEEALTLFEHVYTLLTKGLSEDTRLEDVGKLVVLSGVCQFPMRVKCATLAWHTLRNALRDIQHYREVNNTHGP